MAPHSQADMPQESAAILDAQLREMHGRVVYSHKVHEKESEILLAKLSRVNGAQIILSASTTVGLVTILFGTGSWGSLAGGIFAALLLALNLYTGNYDLGKQAQQHRETANKLWFVREQLLSMIVDLSESYNSIADVRARRDLLTKGLRDIYASAPSTTEKAYERAREALRLGEEMTFSATEVDKFLPEPIRRHEQQSGSQDG